MSGTDNAYLRAYLLLLSIFRSKSACRNLSSGERKSIRSGTKINHHKKNKKKKHQKEAKLSLVLFFQARLPTFSQFSLHLATAAAY
jgi:hypothetical protein